MKVFRVERGCTQAQLPLTAELFKMNRSESSLRHGHGFVAARVAWVGGRRNELGQVGIYVRNDEYIIYVRTTV